MKSNTYPRKIGIIGGMGPQASLELLRLLITKATREYGVRNNDEFPEMVLDSVPVADFISDTRKLAGARSALVNRAKHLQKVGCNPIVMACNSAHILASDLEREIPGEFRSLIHIVAEEVMRRKMIRVGMFATTTTIRRDVYAHVLGDHGITVVNPDQDTINSLERIIRSIIGGKKDRKHRAVIVHEAQTFIEARDLDGVILGCTELSVGAGEIKNKNIVSSLEVLADYLVKSYYNAERSCL